VVLFHQRIWLKIGASHSAYLEEDFWRNMLKHRDSCRLIMNYILPSSKVWSFVPFLHPLLSTGETIVIGKYNNHKKILSWSQFQLEDWKFKEIWSKHSVVTILTIYFNSLISFLSFFQTLKNMLILYFVYVIRGEKFWLDIVKFSTE
jgi:hypothetical protein